MLTTKKGSISCGIVYAFARPTDFFGINQRRRLLFEQKGNYKYMLTIPMKASNVDHKNKILLKQERCMRKVLINQFFAINTHNTRVNHHKVSKKTHI